jgi:23S rRNA pseudouridine2605 synthase
MDLVPKVAGLFPVGRLDVTTEGLILLTNDGEFAQRVSHPRYEVPRVYHAKVRRVPSPETLERLRKGVRVEGERLAVDRARVLEAGNNAWLELTLHEGKHHEVRRLLEAVGHPVSKLKRVALGPLTAKGLEPGEFRQLTPAEVRHVAPAGAASPARRKPARDPRPPAGARR